MPGRKDVTTFSTSKEIGRELRRLIIETGRAEKYRSYDDLFLEIILSLEQELEETRKYP